MNPILKTILITSSPALAASAFAGNIPTTQPSTAPARPSAAIAQSNAPLVIPDGTSPEHPGPVFRNPGAFGEGQTEGSGMMLGVRG